MLKKGTIQRPFKWPYSTRETFEILASSANVVLHRKRKKGFDVDDNNKLAILHICHYLSGEVNDLSSLSKGVMLLGDVGAGKTFLMEVIQEMFLQINKVFTIISAIKIFEAYKANDYTMIRRLETGIICIDDLGSEERSINNWGTIEHPIYQVLMKRSIDERLTFATTNLDAKQLEVRYGKRIRDRLREMCVTIPVVGPSRRK